MKLIAVLGLKDFQQELKEALKKVEVPLFSRIDIHGVREIGGQPDMSNWFGSSTGSESSVAFFAFVPEKEAEEILKVIKQLNEQREGVNPFHAFQLSVDKYV